MALLLLGLGAALVIFLTARPAPPDPMMEDPLARKRFVHEMGVMGGKANVAAADFIAWFGELWHGKNLAGTVTVLTVGVTLAFRFVATLPPAESEQGKRPSPRSA